METVVLNFIMFHLTTMILELYADPHLPRSHVQDIVDKFDYLLKTIILPCILSDIKIILKTSKDPAEILKLIEKCISSYSKIFENYDTESKILAEKGYEDLEEFSIGAEFEQTDLNNSQCSRFVAGSKKYGVHIPLKKSLQMFLKIRGMFPAILRYINKLAQAEIFVKNCMQGTIFSKNYPNWRTIGDFLEDSITLPLLIYFDEFVAGACLGPNATATKFGAVYATLLCLPPFIASKLLSILFSTIIKAKHFADFGNTKVFRQLVCDINSLKLDGIEIVYNGVVKKIYFQCQMVIGDNLGLNSIYGMISCFNADFCCRICKATKDQIHSMVEEDPTLLRNGENYNVDVSLNEPENTGIRERSILNSILMGFTFALIIQLIQCMTLWKV